jgi:hypothetical protein
MGVNLGVGGIVEVLFDSFWGLFKVHNGSGVEIVLRPVDILVVLQRKRRSLKGIIVKNTYCKKGGGLRQNF